LIFLSLLIGADVESTSGWRSVKKPLPCGGRGKSEIQQGLDDYVTFVTVTIIFYFMQKVNPLFQKNFQKNTVSVFRVLSAHFCTATFRTAL
jgi:hypothetical protein